MHELGVLYQAVRAVERIALEHRIKQIKHLTLEVGEESTFVPAYLKKLFPLAADRSPLLQNAQLCIRMVPGWRLVIGEIGY